MAKTKEEKIKDLQDAIEKEKNEEKKVKLQIELEELQKSEEEEEEKGDGLHGLLFAESFWSKELKKSIRHGVYMPLNANEAKVLKPYAVRVIAKRIMVKVKK